MSHPSPIWNSHLLWSTAVPSNSSDHTTVGQDCAVATEEGMQARSATIGRIASTLPRFFFVFMMTSLLDLRFFLFSKQRGESRVVRPEAPIHRLVRRAGLGLG